MSIVVAIVVLVALFMLAQRLTAPRRPAADDRAPGDAVADARSRTDRLGDQVSMLNPLDNDPARQALADAAERQASAERELAIAQRVAQVRIAKRSPSRACTTTSGRRGRRSGSTPVLNCRRSRQ